MRASRDRYTDEWIFPAVPEATPLAACDQPGGGLTQCTWERIAGVDYAASSVHLLGVSNKQAKIRPQPRLISLGGGFRLDSRLSARRSSNGSNGSVARIHQMKKLPFQVIRR
ncbi:MAG: hypothetical protein F9K15_07425 [Zoogloea sp.]|nr:MAG: hypothetical protein F9K15_07425 [Zoogloea sp.]